MLDPLKLRDRRMRKGWTQDDLAKAAGLSRNVIAKMETVAEYDPALSSVEVVAVAMGCGIGMILSAGGIAERSRVIKEMGITKGRPADVQST